VGGWLWWVGVWWVCGGRVWWLSGVGALNRGWGVKERAGGGGEEGEGGKRCGRREGGEKRGRREGGGREGGVLPALHPRHCQYAARDYIPPKRASDWGLDNNRASMAYAGHKPLPITFYSSYYRLQLPVCVEVGVVEHG
jgi:hypothetical protein